LIYIIDIFVQTLADNGRLLASIMNNINHQNTNLRRDAKWRGW